MTENKSFTKRYKIIMAAADIVRNEGVSQLTLEGVATKAGVSKGGLLYHFPNKDALISEMVTIFTNCYTREIQDIVQSDEQPSGKWSRAYLEATVNELEGGVELSAGLLAAVFTNPQLLTELQNQYTVWQRNIENDGIDAVHSTIARLVADGMWFAEIFGLAPIEKNLRGRVVKELVEWTREGEK